MKSVLIPLKILSNLIPEWIIIVPFLPKDVSGMALFPFILVKEKKMKKDEVLINHEKIHLQQQLEMLILPFYLAYFMNYFFNLWSYGSHKKAYFNIFFEKEAYQKEFELDYLEHRPFWAFLAYLPKK